MAPGRQSAPSGDHEVRPGQRLFPSVGFKPSCKAFGFVPIVVFQGNVDGGSGKPKVIVRNGAGIENVFGLEDEAGESDSVVSTGTVKALVDADSTALLTGSSIDYVEGFDRSGFVISNPNFQGGGCACGGGGCGCGG